MDGLNRRVSRLVNGTDTQTYLYNSQLNLVRVRDVNGYVKDFAYGSKKHVPDLMRYDSKDYRIITDHLGSVREVWDSRGNIVQEMRYDAYGKVIYDSNPGFQPFGFAGGLYDHKTGLVRFGARDYDGMTGRWLSKDPILFAGADTNLYAYAFSDPINFIDPTGQEGLCIRFYFSGLWLCIDNKDGSGIWRENPPNQNCYFLCPEDDIRENPPWMPFPKGDWEMTPPLGTPRPPEDITPPQTPPIPDPTPPGNDC